jgi:hypothetical protein
VCNNNTVEKSKEFLCWAENDKGGKMRKIFCLILTAVTIVSISHAGPLIWRSAKTIPAGKAIIQVNLSYCTINRSYNWMDKEWTDIAETSQTDVIGTHFMLGYAPIKRWEAMVHVPVMSKSRDTLSSFGLQDIWIKTRYNFLGAKGKPYLTGVVAVRLPTSSEEAEIALDDRTLDIGLGAIYFQEFSNILMHLRAAYWYNGKTDADIDIGDDVELLFKPEYVFNKKLKVFLSFTYVETFKNKGEAGNEIENSQKRRLTLTPGLVYSPLSGLKIRPKFLYPIEAVSKGGSNFSWKIGLDVWYVTQ